MRMQAISRTGTQAASEYLLIISSALVMSISILEFIANSFQTATSLNSLPFMNLARLSFLLLIFSIFLVVYTYAFPTLKEAWSEGKWKWPSWLAGIGYGIFYIFATNMFNQPEADELATLPRSVLSHGYVVALQVYGPVAVWPDIEFYYPPLNLFGYLSVGSVLLIASLMALTAFAVVLLTQNISLRRSLSGRSTGSFLGTFATALSTNTCCCCGPALVSVTGFLLGGTAASTIGYYLLDPASPIFSLLTLANLLLLVLSIILSTRRYCKLGAGATFPGNIVLSCGSA